MLEITAIRVGLCSESDVLKRIWVLVILPLEFFIFFKVVEIINCLMGWISGGWWVVSDIYNFWRANVKS